MGETRSHPPAVAYPAAGGAAVQLPPPKHGMSTGVKVLLGILAGFAILAVLVIGGCVACGALVFTAVDDELSDTDYGTVGRGQPIEIRGVSYAVTDVETQGRQGGRSEPPAAIILTLEVEKGGGAPGALSRNQFLLETDAGRQLPIDDAAQDRLPDALSFKPLDAGARESGQIVFAVSPGERAGARLRIDAVLGNGHGYVDLER